VSTREFHPRPITGEQGEFIKRQVKVLAAFTHCAKEAAIEEKGLSHRKVIKEQIGRRLGRRMSETSIANGRLVAQLVVSLTRGREADR